LKIATVVPRFTMRGGIERAAAETSIHLQRLGHDVTVFASRRGSDLTDRLQFKMLRTLELTGSSSIFTFGISSRFSIPRRMFDIVHSHGTESAVHDVVTFQSCHLAGLEHQARFPESIRVRRNFGVADRLRLRNEERIFRDRRYNALIAVSAGVKRELCDAYGAAGEGIVVIPNGVNLEEFRQDDGSDRKRVRTALDIPDDAFLLVFVANEFARKGLRIVIDALSHLNRKDIMLLVAGKDATDPYLRYARKLGVDGQIRFCGPVPGPAPLYRSGDVFVLPTSYEAFPLAMLEGAASGLPLLISRVHGADEFVVEGLNGFFIERDGEDLGRAILRLIQEPELRARLAKNAHKSATAYSWQTITEGVLTVYKNVPAP
jgi:UDP-glucose:(heptosyl)LPS alpha-1,3-glucosyltransferase